MERFCLSICMLNEGRGWGGSLLGCALKWRAKRAEGTALRSEVHICSMADSSCHCGLHLKSTLAEACAGFFRREVQMGEGWTRKWHQIKFILCCYLKALLSKDKRLPWTLLLQFEPRKQISLHRRPHALHAVLFIKVFTMQLMHYDRWKVISIQKTKAN